MKLEGSLLSCAEAIISWFIIIQQSAYRRLHPLNIDFPSGDFWLCRLRATYPLCMPTTQPSHHINGLIGCPSNMLPATRTATRSPCNSMSLARFMWHAENWIKKSFCKYTNKYFHSGNNLLHMQYQAIRSSSTYLSPIGPQELHFVQAPRKEFRTHTKNYREVMDRYSYWNRTSLMWIPFTIKMYICIGIALYTDCVIMRNW